MALPELVRECELRVKRNVSFEKEEWVKAISAKSVSDGRIRQMILNYFISEGYQSAAEMFAKESGLQLGRGNQEIIRIKDRIRSCLQRCSVAEVIEELDRFNPSILKDNEELLLNLHLVTYCRMIRSGDFEAALEFITEKAQKYMEENRFAPLIEDHLLLLVLKDPLKGPSAELLSESRILDLNTRINKELNQRMDAEIIVMMKLMKWMEKRLNQKGKVPRISDLSKLQFCISLN